MLLKEDIIKMSKLIFMLERSLSVVSLSHHRSARANIILKLCEHYKEECDRSCDTEAKLLSCVSAETAQSWLYIKVL